MKGSSSAHDHRASRRGPRGLPRPVPHPHHGDPHIPRRPFHETRQRPDEKLCETLRVSHDRDVSPDSMFCHLMKFWHFSKKKRSFFFRSHSLTCMTINCYLDFFFFSPEEGEGIYGVQQMLKLGAEQLSDNLNLIPDPMGPFWLLQECDFLILLECSAVYWMQTGPPQMIWQTSLYFNSSVLRND